MRVAVIGAGKVGTALTRALSSAGVSVSGPLGRAPWAEAPLAEADVVILAVPDAVIAEVAAALQDTGCLGDEVVLLHTAGALGERALADAAPGVHAGTFHPLQTFASRVTAPPLTGVPFALAGDEAALRVGRALADRLGGVALELPEERRALYHAAAVLACGHAALLSHAAARALANAARIDETDALALLAPIARATQANVERLGFPAAMTGPVARGDEATLTRHREALGALAPELAAVYEAMVNFARQSSSSA